MTMQEKSVRNFTKSIIFAFVAQFVSLAASVLISLILPKLLGVEQFSYWQLFIFYSTYVGFFHFGLSDGIYLRYGGTRLDELDKPLIGSQFRFMMLWQLLICAVVLSVVFLRVAIPERRIVWVCIAIYLLLANGCWFWGYVYQAANQTRVYSLTTIISKLSFILFMGILIATRPERFEIFIILYVTAQLLAFLYSIWKSRSFLAAGGIPLKQTAMEICQNIKIGICLTISNIASSMILGVGRGLVDMTQTITEFGLLSFAISLANFFLQFISQISMVMFPALRQIHLGKTKEIFVSLRKNSSFLLCFILVFYIPMKYLLLAWLPQYEASLNYLAYLLPICVFDGKMQLLYSTYMKVLRKERPLLCINLLSLLLSTALCAIGTFVLKDMTSIVLFMVASIATRSILANAYISKELRLPFEMNTLWECFLAGIFILSNMKLRPPLAFLIYLAAYGAYAICYRRDIAETLTLISRALRKGRARD